MNSQRVTPRKFELKLEQDIPRYWCNDSPFMTHMLNTYTLLVPDNENYYIRQLSRYLDSTSDPDLAQRLQNFCRQEAQHGISHKMFWKNLDQLGIRYQGFVKAVGWFNYKLVEPTMPKCINLANIAYIEHINARIGEFYLRKQLLRDAEPSMKTLFNWHFAEEIEHKSVAHDVFLERCGNYFIRVLGAMLVFPLFYLFNTLGTIYLLYQDRQLFRWKTCVDAARFLFRDGAALHALGSLAIYLKPGFHPSQFDDYELAEQFFSEKEHGAALKEYPPDAA